MSWFADAYDWVRTKLAPNPNFGPDNYAADEAAAAADAPTAEPDMNPGPGQVIVFENGVPKIVNAP